MATRIITINNDYDLSEIKNAEQLKEEIDFLKASIKKEHRALESHFRKLPQEVLKASADAVLPSFLNKMIANGSWKILTSGAGLLVNPFSKKLSFGKQIFGAARKLGVMAAVKGAYSLWRRKDTNRPNKSLVRPPAIKTITESPKPKPIK